MTDPLSTPRRPGRTIWAVVAGILLNVILTTAIDHVFHATGVYPPYGEPMWDTGLLLLALSYRLVLSFAGMYLTAVLAPYRVVRLLWITAGIGTVLGVLGLVATLSAKFSPLWYPVAIMLSAFPTAWLVAKVYVARHGDR